ncbi:TPA: hypothetical protein DDZ86_00935 [Candidatus Dependentiae bacterium]|nr:MAG: hypothetical protein UW09_C0004G0069 [candidate division TM6 bacterium GW2011_GWF2_43_87]HBL98190.1 hypothetical protein [Candidatus Dependentiae bacterium]
MISSLLIGTFLILSGISIFFNILFGIHIPFGRIFFGLFLLYVGFMLITNFSKYQMEWHCCSTYQGSLPSYSNWMGTANVLLDEQTLIQSSGLCEYLTVMGSTTLDLSHITPEILAKTTNSITMSIDTIMGKTIVKINKDVPIRINARGAFSGTALPDGDAIVFGARSYFSHGPTVAPRITINTSTVMGSLSIFRV